MRRLPHRYVRQMAVELAKLTDDPKVKDALYGWTFSYEYPDSFEWFHPARPDGSLSATPDYHQPQTVPTQWTSYEAGMESGPDVPIQWVGNDPKLDAAIYLHRMTPYLMLVVSQGFGGEKIGLANRAAGPKGRLITDFGRSYDVQPTGPSRATGARLTDSPPPLRCLVGRSPERQAPGPNLRRQPGRPPGRLRPWPSGGAPRPRARTEG